MSRILIQGDWLDGFSSGKKAALLDWEHKKEKRSFKILVNRLRSRKWAKENPEKAAARALRWYRAHPEQVRDIQRAHRARKYREAPPTFTCVRCGVTWCKAPWVKGLKPRFCSDACYQRHYYRTNEAYREKMKSNSRVQYAKKGKRG